VEIYRYELHGMRTRYRSKILNHSSKQAEFHTKKEQEFLQITKSFEMVGICCFIFTLNNSDMSRIFSLGAHKKPLFWLPFFSCTCLTWSQQHYMHSCHPETFVPFTLCHRVQNMRVEKEKPREIQVLILFDTLYSTQPFLHVSIYFVVLPCFSSRTKWA
jgi:hypothetical protein